MLINPIQITVTPLDRAAPPTDALAREQTTRRRYLPAITIAAQLDYDAQSSRHQSGTGGSARLRHSAAITILRVDADALGWRPDKGDLVTGIVDEDGNTDATALYVVKAEHDAPWLGGKFKQYKLMMSDEGPGRLATNPTSV